MRLTGRQFEQFTDALVKAFPTDALLERFVQFRLEKNLYEIAMGDDLTEIAFKLIRTAQAEGWVAELVDAALASKPKNLTFRVLALELKIATSTPSVPVLERMIRETNSFLDVNTWRERLGEIETQVCRIENTLSKNRGFGTGFLIAPNVVITNYHVIEAVIKGQAAPSDVILRFDYKELANKRIINSGTEYHLAEDWLIDKSPYVMGNPLPKRDELDYTLLRVDGVPGEEGIGKNPEPGSAKRGWIKLPEEPYYEFSPNTPLFILQHPNTAPLKLALDTDAIISINENGTTVRYKTNTEPGSSGSPCFNIKWELVALHHSGAPDWHPTYNAGTPFSAICSLLEERGILKSLLSNQPI